MNILGIKTTDFIQNNEVKDTVTGAGVTSTEESKKTSNEALRAISFDNAYYDKKLGKKNDDLLSDIEKAQGMGLDTKDQITMITDAYYQANEKIEEDGDDPQDTDALTIATVVDEIRLALAKGGADTGAMQPLSEEELKAMGVDYVEAAQMYDELPDTLSDEAKTYLIENELPPTVNNFYDASYKAPIVSGISQESNRSDEEVAKLMETLSTSIDKVLEEAGYEKDDAQAEKLVAELLKKNLPVTAENVQYIGELNEYEKADKADFVQDVSDIVYQGKDAKDAYMIPGYSYMDQARDLYDDIMSIDVDSIEDIKSRRALEETRLIMTVQANFTLIKKGIAIDTNDLVDLVDKLKSLEDAYAKSMFGSEQTAEAVLDFKETNSVVSEIKELPAAVLGSYKTFEDFENTTLHEINAKGQPMKERFEKAMDTYEALWTAPRRDMGDSIKKAFEGSVDSVLNNLELETTESNRRAVRILSLNQMDVTKEAVLNVKASDEMMQSAFKALTPRTVAELIKEGTNPLDMKMSELIEKANEIKTAVSSDGSKDSENFAEFLWKAEQLKGISEDERNSFIGIYRLLHQVSTSEGAAVGAVLAQGNEVTLRNLMTAVTSKKHSNREYELDVNAGLAEVNVKDLPIIMQVQAAFETSRAKDALESMTPSKVMAMEEDPYEMTPDMFASTMENMAETDEGEQINESYKKHVAQNMSEAFASDAEVYDFIARYDLPSSSNMLLAMKAFLGNRNEGMRKIFSQIGEEAEGKTLDDVINDVIKEWGEAAETPEDMARAQEALANRAENAMKNMLDAEPANYIDLRSMKLVATQFRTFSTMAKKDQTYHVPIMVADKFGNMTLKIVNGESETGRIDLSLNMEGLGQIDGVIKYQNGGISMSFKSDNVNTSDKIRRRQLELTEELENGLDGEAPTTAKLYQISKKVISSLGSYLS